MAGPPPHGMMHHHHPHHPANCVPTEYDYGMAHAGFAHMQHQPHQQQQQHHQHQHQHQQQDFVQRMAGMTLSSGGGPQQQQQQGAAAAAMHRASSTGSGGGGGRSEGRASARIARSHRAGGAYNPAEVRGVASAGCVLVCMPLRCRGRGGGLVPFRS